MSKTWYPVIDYERCAECGACTEKCSHGVYNLQKAPAPVVVNPEGCVQGCHGCGSICPNGAITYIGENTDWVPPHGKPIEKAPDCDCGCESSCDCGSR
jgi:NAD-dependent dihydropyrimidine dehydrogenase PreA subunit